MATEKELNDILAEIQPNVDIPEEEEEEKLDAPAIATIAETPVTEEIKEESTLSSETLDTLAKDVEVRKTFKVPQFLATNNPAGLIAEGLLNPEKTKNDIISLYDSFTGFFTDVVPAGFKSTFPTVANAIDIYQQRRIAENVEVATGREEPPDSLISPNPFIFSDIEKAVKKDEFRKFQEETWNQTPIAKKAEIIESITSDYDALEERIKEREKYIEGVYEQHGLGKEGRAAASGVTSFTLMAPAFITTALTRNPAFAYSILPVFGQLESTATYRESLQSGLTHREAAAAGDVSGALEIGTELISLPFVTRGLKAFRQKNKGKLENFITNGFATVATELGAENLNTFLQETNKAVRGVKNELNIAWNLKDDPTYKGPSWIDVLRDNAEMTTIATLVGAGGIVTTQGAVQYSPEVKSFLNSLDPNVGRKIARELDTMSKEVESNFHAMDDTFLSLAKYANKQGIMGRNFGRFSTNEPIDLENANIDQLLNPTRESFELGAPDFLVDAELTKNILKADTKIPDLSPEEKILVSELNDLLTEEAEVDFEDILKTNKNVLKIMGVSATELLDTDSFTQKVKDFAANIEERITTAKDSVKENLQNDLETLNKFVNYFSPTNLTTPDTAKASKDITRDEFPDTDEFKKPIGTVLAPDFSEQDVPVVNHSEEQINKIKNTFITNFLIRAAEKKEGFITFNQLKTTESEKEEGLSFSTSLETMEKMNLYDISAEDIKRIIDIGRGKELPEPEITKDKTVEPEFIQQNLRVVGRYRSPTEAEDVRLAEILDITFQLGLPEKALTGLNSIKILRNEIDESIRGEYYESSATITLDQEYFNTEQDKNFLNYNAAQTFLHEIAHHIDFTYNQKTDGSGISLAFNSPLFAFPDFKKESVRFAAGDQNLQDFSFETGGEVFNEIYNLFRNSNFQTQTDALRLGRAMSEDQAVFNATMDNRKLGGLLAYPMNSLFVHAENAFRVAAVRQKIKDGDIVSTEEIESAIGEVEKYYKNFGMKSTRVPKTTFEQSNFPQHLASEMFAQVFSLKYTNSEFFKLNAPRTTKLIEDIENAISLNTLNEVSSGLRTAFGYDSSQPDFKIYRLNQSYLNTNRSFAEQQESERVGEDDSADATESRDGQVTGIREGERSGETTGEQGGTQDSRINRSGNLTPNRDESSGHAADKVPPQYGPPAHDLNQEATQEITARGDSTFSFDAGENYENLKYFYDRRYKEETELINKLREIKGNPDAILTVYRAAPTSELRYGDLVTLTKEDAEFQVAESKITQEEVDKANRERARQEDIEKTGAIDLQKEKNRDIMDRLFRPPDVTPSKLHTYEIRAGDIRFDGNGGLTRWGFFPSNVVNIKGDRSVKLISSKRKDAKEPTKTQDQIDKENALTDAIEAGQVRKPPEGPPPPPKGPDPNEEFTIPQLGFYKDLVEAINIKVANRFGRQWTLEESMIEQFGEAGIVERLQELGLDPDAKDWRVTTQTDIYQGKVKDLLRDLADVYYEPMLKFLTLNAITETKYNHFVYSLHAPERNAYLPTKFTESIAEAEADLRTLEAEGKGSKQDVINAKRKLTTLQNKLKKAESGSGMTTEQAIKNLEKYGVEYKNGVATGVTAKGAAYLKAYENFHKPMIEYMRKTYTDSGLITQDRVSDWNQRYNYYVPLKGFAEDTLIDPKTGREIKRLGTSNNLIKSQMTVSGQIVKKAKGRESLADSPLQQSVVDTVSALIQSEKNVIVKSLADLSRAFPNDQFWLVIEDAGQMENVDATWDDVKGKSRIGFKEDGVQKYVELYDKRLAQGFDDFDNTITGSFMKGVRYATRYLSMVNTSLDPAFMINNFIRDVQTAYFNLLAEEEITSGRAQGLEISKKYFTSLNILNNAKLLIKFEKNKTLANKGMKEEMAELQRSGEKINIQLVKELGEKYNLPPELVLKNAKMLQFKKYGGETGYIDQKNIEQMTQEFQTLRDIYSGSIKAAPKKALRDSLAIIERFNSGVENAARFTAFEGYIEMIGGIDAATPKDFEKAATLAKNLTINFNRMGTMGPTANAMYMFFNASIQGSVNVARGLVGKDRSSRKVKAVAALGALGSLQTLWNVLYAAEDEDDGVNWYKKIPDWEKQTKFIFMYPDIDLSKGKITVDKWGKGSKYYVISDDGERKLPIGLGIPKPYGYALFHDIGRITTEYALSKAVDNYNVSFQEAAVDLGESLLHNYAPLTFGDRDNLGETLALAVTPSVAKPVVNWMQNKDHFGAPIKTSEAVRDLIGDTMPRSYNQSRKALGFTKALTKTINDITGGNQFYEGAVDIDPRTLQFFLGEATGGLGRTSFRFYQAGEALVTGSPLPPTDILGLRRIVAGPRDYVDSEIYERNIQELLKFEGASNQFADTDLDEEKMSETEEEFEARIGTGLDALVVVGDKETRESLSDIDTTYKTTTKEIKELNKQLRELNLEYQAAETFEEKMELEAEKKEIQLDILVVKKNFNQEFNEAKEDVKEELEENN